MYHYITGVGEYTACTGVDGQIYMVPVTSAVCKLIPLLPDHLRKYLAGLDLKYLPGAGETWSGASDS